MRASERLFGRGALLRFGRSSWAGLVGELGRRAGGERESGAFLLAPSTAEWRVTRIVYFDDLDPDALDGGVALHAPAFSALWDLCRREALAVIGDVHTHPASWVDQSSIDRGSSMVGRRGHVALIVPDLAARTVRPREVGVHRHDGGGAWTSWTGRDAERRLYVGRWP